MIQDSRFKFHDRRGFTLTEFLIVIAIVMILSTIVLINLQGKNQSERFHSAVLRLVGTINEAVENSKTLKDINAANLGAGFSAVKWGVRFVPSGCAGGPGHILILFDGLNKKYGQYVLPEGVVYDISFVPQASCSTPNNFKEIKFKQNTGEPENVAEAKIRIYLVSNPAVSSTISVSPLGQVIYTSSGNSLGS